MPDSIYIKPGDQFGRWQVLAEGSPATNRHGHKIRRIRCQCSCSAKTIRDVLLQNLTSGKSVSCGCIKREATIARSTKHGKCRHPLYKIWQIIKYRCSQPSNPVYHSYNTLHISVCDEWQKDFRAFYNWAIENGWQPGLDIDRRNNLEGYSPSNCRFVTRPQNCRNKRTNRIVSYQGRELCITDLAREVGLSHKTITGRLARGQTVEQAVTHKPLGRDPITGRWK